MERSIKDWYMNGDQSCFTARTRTVDIEVLWSVSVHPESTPRWTLCHGLCACLLKIVWLVRLLLLRLSHLSDTRPGAAAMLDKSFNLATSAFQLNIHGPCLPFSPFLGNSDIYTLNHPYIHPSLWCHFTRSVDVLTVFLIFLLHIFAGTAQKTTQQWCKGWG